MEHIIALLRRHGFTDICATICSHPEQIRDYFGDGSDFGIRLCYSEELEPMGTAGGVKKCADFIGDEDVLIISGDAACDFDLGSLMTEHKKSGAAATIALTEHSDPLRYGLVLTDRGGGVVSFIEKPDWSRVVTNLVNTGIYILSPTAMRLIPESSKYDFGQNLFPDMLARGIRIQGVISSGYWCDIGNPAEFLRCSMDALRGTLSLEHEIPLVSNGIYSASPLPKSTKLHAPCFIAEDVIIAENTELGPDVIISPHSILGRESRISASIIDGAEIGAGAIIEGSIICRGATIKPNQRVKAGSVVGAAGAEPAPRRKPLAVRSGASGAELGEIPCRDRAKAMRLMSESLMEMAADFTDGLIISKDGGRVRISPAAQKSALVIESLSGLPADRTLASEFALMAQGFDA